MATTLGTGIRLALQGATVVAALGLASDARAYSRAYFCFFDKNSAEPTARCKQVASAFVAEWTAERDGTSRSYLAPFALLPATERRVVVAGHAQDDSAPGADQRLSDARAAGVAALLEHAGVPSRLITATGYGSQQLFVPDSGDPQNRRVQISTE